MWVDIAFIIFRLIYFIINPEPEHYATADRMFLYFQRHRDLNLQFRDNNKFIIANNASFADNLIN